MMTLAVSCRVHCSCGPQEGWLLRPSPHITSRPCFLPPVPLHSKGLGQAAVLHMAGAGASVLRGHSYHHPGLVGAISTGKDVSPRLSVLRIASLSPAQTDSSGVEVIGQALECPVFSRDHVAGECHRGRLCGGIECGF